MSDIRSQVDQLLAAATFLDPTDPKHDDLHYESDIKVAMKDAIGGLIQAVRLLADQLDER